MNRVVQGLLIHSDWLAAYGLDETGFQGISRATLPVADRLRAIFTADKQQLRLPRPPGGRAVGTCRDYALMLCSFLRAKGVPSRVRCGFASYFSSAWEDHWVCEYWDRQAQTWRLSDPQIDKVLKDRCRIDFDLEDVPARAFVAAGQAWSHCRSGKSDPARFGHGDVTGLWFIKVNVVRDHYTVNGWETSVWDGWRAAAPSRRTVADDEIALLDGLAAQPEQPLVEVDPGWPS